MKLGRINVDAMLKEITAKQFVEWEVYARLEPFNELRADARAASISQMIFNMAVDPKHRKVELEDFLLKFKGEVEKPKLQPKQTQHRLNAIMQMWAASQPSKDSEG